MDQVWEIPTYFHQIHWSEHRYMSVVRGAGGLFAYYRPRAKGNTLAPLLVSAIMLIKYLLH